MHGVLVLDRTFSTGLLSDIFHLHMLRMDFCTIVTSMNINCSKLLLTNALRDRVANADGWRIVQWYWSVLGYHLLALFLLIHSNLPFLIWVMICIHLFANGQALCTFLIWKPDFRIWQLQVYVPLVEHVNGHCSVSSIVAHSWNEQRPWSLKNCKTDSP